MSLMIPSFSARDGRERPEQITDQDIILSLNGFGCRNSEREEAQFRIDSGAQTEKRIVIFQVGPESRQRLLLPPN